MANKQVVVAITRGSLYGANAPGEFVEPYLKFVFNILGIRDVTFVRTEGLGISQKQRRAGIQAALAAIQAPLALAA